MQIFQRSQQWRYVQFQMQIILGDPSIQLIKIIKYDNKFKSQYDMSMKIDAAVDITSLSSEQKQSIYSGNTSKIIFEGGHININNKNKRMTRQMLLFKLAVDNMLPIHRTGYRQLSKISQFPNKIDTIYISQNKEQLNVYPHKFKVKQKGQALLQYQVQYRIRGIQNMKKWIPAQIICESCCMNKAQTYCKNQKQLFCLKCYDQGHQSQKKKKHIKQQIAPYNSASNCPYHKKNRFSLYCLNCKELKCDECIQSEEHRQKKHQQIDLTELFSIFKTKQVDFSNQVKSKLRQMMIKIEKKIDKIEKDYLIEQKDLQDRFAAKLSKIKAETNQKLSHSIAVHCELKRKYDQFLWIQSYMNYTQEFLIVEDSILIKQAFAKYLQEVCTRQYFQNLQKKSELT